MASRCIDLTGQTFGLWSVIERVDDDKNRNVRFLCQCACGKRVPVLSQSLRSGKSSACVDCCLTNTVKSSKTPSTINHHGLSKHRLYSNYQAMINRCYNYKATCYESYGGSGVTVCERWLGVKGLEHFIEDMNHSYFDGAHLDKDKFSIPNQPKTYSPETCCWITPEENIFIRDNPHLYPLVR